MKTKNLTKFFGCILRTARFTPRLGFGPQNPNSGFCVCFLIPFRLCSGAFFVLARGLRWAHRWQQLHLQPHLVSCNDGWAVASLAWNVLVSTLLPFEALSAQFLPLSGAHPLNAVCRWRWGSQGCRRRMLLFLHAESPLERVVLLLLSSQKACRCRFLSSCRTALSDCTVL